MLGDLLFFCLASPLFYYYYIIDWSFGLSSEYSEWAGQPRSKEFPPSKVLLYSVLYLLTLHLQTVSTESSLSMSLLRSRE